MMRRGGDRGHSKSARFPHKGDQGSSPLRGTRRYRPSIWFQNNKSYNVLQELQNITFRTLGSEYSPTRRGHDRSPSAPPPFESKRCLKTFPPVSIFMIPLEPNLSKIPEQRKPPRRSVLTNGAAGQNELDFSKNFRIK
jgi:hypothetical protein